MTDLSTEPAPGAAPAPPAAGETRLRELGGRFESAPNWQPFAVRDGQLITGQNPQSSEEVVRVLMDALKGKPAPAS